MIDFTREAIQKELKKNNQHATTVARYLGITYKQYCERFRRNMWTMAQKIDVAKIVYTLTGETPKIEE